MATIGTRPPPPPPPPPPVKKVDAKPVADAKDTSVKPVKKADAGPVDVQPAKKVDAQKQEATRKTAAAKEGVVKVQRTAEQNLKAASSTATRGIEANSQSAAAQPPPSPKPALAQPAAVHPAAAQPAAAQPAAAQPAVAQPAAAQPAAAQPAAAQPTAPTKAEGPAAISTDADDDDNEPGPERVSKDKALKMWDTVTKAIANDYALFPIERSGVNSPQEWNKYAGEQRQKLAGMFDDKNSDIAAGRLQEWTVDALEPALNDGHTSITRNDASGETDDPDVAIPDERYYAYEDKLEAGLRDSAANYVEGGKLKTPTGDDASETGLAWGKLKTETRPDGTKEKVGYVSLTNFAEEAWGTSDEKPMAEQMEAVDKRMTEMLGDLEGSDRIVVDIAHNGGGMDWIANRVTSYFAADPTKTANDGTAVAWAKRTMEDGTLGARQESLVPKTQPDAFAGKVDLLTSPVSFSAAETFALAMESRANVERVGTATAGHYSDISDDVDLGIPTWKLNMSSDRYYSPSGEFVEGKGRQPDVPLDLGVDKVDQVKDAIDNGRHPWLDALSKLRR